MNTMFTVEENNLICIFAGESRREVMEDMERALPYLEDMDMQELVKQVLKKLDKMSDEEFATIIFEAAE